MSKQHWHARLTFADGHRAVSPPFDTMKRAQERADSIEGATEVLRCTGTITGAGCAAKATLAEAINAVCNPSGHLRVETATSRRRLLELADLMPARGEMRV